MLAFLYKMNYNIDMKNIICSISTPLGKGAISIVRLSGKGSLDVMKKVFSSSALSYENIVPNYLYLGKFLIEENLTEKCFAVYFKSPKSYTGEDMVEFQIHGGTILAQKVLEKLIEQGAKLAEAGEFTKRAFENGKISLDMAESIIGEINAESEGELKASLGQAEGRLFKKIKSLQNGLTESIAKIEATLDYPEEDIEQSTREEVSEIIKSTKSTLENLIISAENSKFISNGINIAIVGAPNVGKSSLLNSLIGEDRAIVTNIEGTTRDILTESTSFKGIKFNFIDTAGIRESEDTVEKIGIERAKKAVETADVIIFVLDGSREINPQDEQIQNFLSNFNNVITVVNKTDLSRKLPVQKEEIEISALKEENIEKIKEKIYFLVIKEEISFDKTILLNTRQAQILSECKNIINQIEESLNSSMDITAMLIKNLWNTLGKITGECENENIIDLIFSKFCLGK